jgi:signal transduction histidine kinase
MEPGLGPESAAVEAALVAWRGKAANVLLAASAALYLPALVLLRLGYGPTVGSLVRTLCLTAYLVIAATALLRRVDYRPRLCAYFVATYLVVALGAIVNHRGPYAQVGLVAQPILVLVLCGSAAARVAILASATILASAPFLRVLPGVARALALDPAQTVAPSRLVWFQAAVLAAFLAILWILLDRFHRFLLGALAAQCREMRERQRLEREIAGISDEERRRLGQELHDGVCQQVTAALLRCQALERRLERGGTLAGADFHPLSSLLAETIDDAHNVALGLCPLEPDPEALAPALRALIKRTGELAAVRCEFLAAGDVWVPDPAMAQHLYRIAQEALSNAVRHAHASRIAVELRGSAGEVTLQVEDDGTGIPAEHPGGGLGLRTMAYRAQILAGELTVTPVAGGGTRVTCRVPRSDSKPSTRDDSGGKQCLPAA